VLEVVPKVSHKRKLFTMNFEYLLQITKIKKNFLVYIDICNNTLKIVTKNGISYIRVKHLLEKLSKIIIKLRDTLLQKILSLFNTFTHSFLSKEPQLNKKILYWYH